MPIKQATKAKPVKVAFRLPAEIDADQIVLYGEFNDWPTDTEITRIGDGSGQTTISVTPAVRRDRYLLDGTRWENAGTPTTTFPTHTAATTRSLSSPTAISDRHPGGYLPAGRRAAAAWLRQRPCSPATARASPRLDESVLTVPSKHAASTRRWPRSRGARTRGQRRPRAVP